MQWRLIDLITGFKPWQELRADKAVSLEEYYLKERLGQPGEFPESLLLESCAQAASWLVAVSSDFTLNAMIETVTAFTVKRTLQPGERCHICISVCSRNPDNITVCCHGRVGNEEILGGEIILSLIPLAEHWVPGERKSLWREIFRAEENI